MDNAKKKWVGVACFVGFLASLQGVSITGDVATQIVMFPFYSIIFGGFVVLIGLALSKAIPSKTGNDQHPISSNPQRVSVPSSKTFRPVPAAGGLDRGAEPHDFYHTAGKELLDGAMEPSSWARALVETEGDESSIKAVYVRLRVEQLKAQADASMSDAEESDFLYDQEVRLCCSEFDCYDEDRLKHELAKIETLISSGDAASMAKFRQAKNLKIGRVPPSDDPKGFLLAVQRRIRSQLELF